VGTAYHPCDANVRELAQYVDAVSMERQWGYIGLSPLDLPLWELGLHTQMVRAEGRKPVYSSIFIDKQVDFDYSPRSPDHIRLNFMGILQHGATVQVHIQNEYEIDRTTMPVMAELYAAELKMRPYLLDSVLASIAAYVESGGGLVMTYRTGLRDEQGHPRERPGLAALAGVRSLAGEITNPSPEIFIPPRTTLPQTYYRVTADEAAWSEVCGQLLSFMGSYVETEAEPDALQIAQVIDFDYSRMHPDHTAIGWYPWEPIRPLIVGRQVGRGRAVYLAAELDGASLRFGDPAALAVLAAAVRWARGGNGGLGTNAQPSVEIARHRSRDGARQCVILTNRTTNQHYPDPVRYVVPIPDVEVRMQMDGAAVGEVQTVTGQAASWHQADGWVTVRLEHLEAYEGLLIDLAQ